MKIFIKSKYLVLQRGMTILFFFNLNYAFVKITKIFLFYENKSVLFSNIEKNNIFGISF